jgi:hypothetical protein
MKHNTILAAAILALVLAACTPAEIKYVGGIAIDLIDLKLRSP